MRIKIEAPCCSSIRECNVRKVYIINVRTLRIIEEIGAVRCYRGEKKVVFVNVDNNIIVAEHYVSNRGRHQITIIYKPDDMSREKADEITRKALGVWEEEEDDHDNTGWVSG